MTLDPGNGRREYNDGQDAGGTPSEPLVHQDSYRRVMFGQAVDPVFPPHPSPPEVPEADLDQQALMDTPLPEPEDDRPTSTLWRWFLLAAIALAALGILFLRR
jgi:hypothetical protein